MGLNTFLILKPESLNKASQHLTLVRGNTFGKTTLRMIDSATCMLLWKHNLLH